MTIGELLGDIWTSLGANGWQTGWALIAGALATTWVARDAPVLTVPAFLGGFWIGWAAFNTLTRSGAELFPGDLGAWKLWDVIRVDQYVALAVAGVVAFMIVAVWGRRSWAARAVTLVVVLIGVNVILNLFSAWSPN